MKAELGKRSEGRVRDEKEKFALGFLSGCEGRVRDGMEKFVLGGELGFQKSHSEGCEGQVFLFSFYCDFSVIPCSSLSLNLKSNLIPKAVKAKSEMSLS